jgi:arylsulfatase A-like enzyme
MQSLKGLLVLLFVLLWTSTWARAQQTQPSFLIVVLDDVGWEDVSTLPLPNLQTYAPLARVYTNAFGCPVCSPSRVGMLSGTYPHRAFVGTALNAASTVEKGMPVAWKTVPEVLAANGYSTALFGKCHVSSSGELNTAEMARVHGFETWRAGVVSNIIAPQSHYNWTRVDDGKTTTSTTYSTTAVFNETCAWWAATPGPKFAVCAPMAPHEPFEAPPANTLPPGYVIGTSNRAKYEAALIGLDWHLSSLLTTLDLSTTHVIVVSDNGTAHQVPPPMGQSPGYKLTQYQGGVNVPLLWWGPGVLPGADSSLLHTMDLAGTVLELCSITPAAGFEDTLSFVDTLTGGPGRRQHAYLARFDPNTGTAAALTIDNWSVVREDGWKLVRQGSVYRLFNLSNDPWEQGGFGPNGPGLAGVTADLLNYRAQVLGPNWPY